MLDRTRSARWLVSWTGLAALLASTALSCLPVQAIGLNDTGITTCSNESQKDLPCPVAGLPGQDAEHGTNGFDFTKLDANGNDLPDSATDHACVRDNVTGLIWEVKTDDGGLRDMDWTYSWYDSSAPGGHPGTADGGICHDAGRCDTARYVADVNAAGLCGASDWRMPGVKELFGILDLSRYFPTIDTGYFPNIPIWPHTALSPNSFWSGSPVAFNSGNAWRMDFDDGHTDGYLRSEGNHVQLVRGGQSFDSFVDQGDGTVTQTTTGLMWAKCSEGQSGANCATGNATEMVWIEALTAASNSLLGGYDDWRLPNVKELQALVDYNRASPAIDTGYFPNTPNGVAVWSGSPGGVASYYAWFVYYSGGVAAYWSSVHNDVRLVRDGQSFDALELTVAKTGSGRGAVTSAPAGIDCGGDCADNYPGGTVVTLTATATTGSTFASWTGCTPLAANPRQCQVTLNRAETVTATFRAAPPDFVVMSIASNPTSPAANGTFSATITVKNQGAVSASGGNLLVWTNQSAGQTCGATADRSMAVGTLAAGASNTLTVTGLTAGTAGNKTLRAFVDGACATAETNESNNQLTKMYTVSVANQPDWIVTAINLSPVSPLANSTLTATITVKNQGRLAGDGGYIDVWAHQPTVQTCGTQGEWAEIGNLAAGASKTITVRLRAKDAGAKTLRVFVDSWCETAESNETNNQSTKSYTVR